MIPDSDEFEMSVFGGGYGECICVHIGNGEWVVVDSCIDPTTNRPAALAYLESLGIDTSVGVRLIIVTHWDDDHIRGMAKTVEECTSAKVAISAALGKREILAFVEKQSSLPLASGSGVDELRAILQLCRVTRPPVLAKCNVVLLLRPSPTFSEVKALSPSDDACLRSVELLIEGATKKKIDVARKYRAPEGSNGASVVSFVDSLDTQVLLGADLERSSNPLSGWGAVVSDSLLTSRATAVKVPHHGAESGHDSQMWSELLVDGSLAIIAPWIRGGRALPSQHDLSRLGGLAAEVYVTSVPSTGTVRRSPEVTRLIRRTHSRKPLTSRGWGQVRARKRIGEVQWRVELVGNAAQVS